MKSSYAKDLNCLIQRAICASAFHFLMKPKLTRGFKWYMDIKVINLISYLVSNNAVL